MFTPGSILTLTALILAVVSVLGVLLFQIGTFLLVCLAFWLTMHNTVIT